MKLNLLGTTVILLVAFLPRHECRAIDGPGGAVRVLAPQNQNQNSPQQQQRQQQRSGPILERLGEEYFVRLGNGDSNSLPSSSVYPGAAPGLFSGAPRLQLTQRLLQGKVGNIRALIGGFDDREDDDSMERGRRSEDPPISLDLTFHLLREMMEMSRAEQMAQQAQSNRKMMEIFGK